MRRPLRLLLYDRTCAPGARDGRPIPLSPAWRAGAWLYRSLDRIDLCFGAASWREAIDWILATRPEARIGEIQYWGHGQWGEALCGFDRLDRGAFARGSPLADGLRVLRGRLLDGGESLLWFRTCQLFGGRAGHDFARASADFFEARVAGHTFVIGFHQSGLHSLKPGQAPGWPLEEGIARGTPDEPQLARPSRPWAVNTITCLHGRIPDGY
jgi:hypothetical protein